MSDRTGSTRIRPRARGAAAALVAVFVLAACGSDSSSDGDDASANGDSDDTVVLDGFVTYTVPDGWEVVEEAQEWEAVRGDEGGPPRGPAQAETQILLQLERSDPDGRVILARDKRFLDGDYPGWADDLYAGWVGDAEVVDTSKIDLPHGTGDRVDYETPGEQGIFVATEVGDQRLALVAAIESDADDEVIAQVDEILAGLVVDPDVAVPPLLHYYGAYVSANAGDGTELGEVWLDVPMGWEFEEYTGSGGAWVDQSGPGRVEIYISRDEDGGDSQDWFDQVAEDYENSFGEEITRTTRDLGGDTFEVFGMGKSDEVSLWIFSARVDGILVDIWVIGDPEEPETALLDAIIETLEFHPA